MSDLIERQEAIDAAESAFVRGVFPTPYIRELPSAQPEIRTQMSSANLISRQEAIDILDAFEVKIENGEPFAYSWARMRITELPSAQPPHSGRRVYEAGYEDGFEDGHKEQKKGK